ncbi:MAG: cation transporter [Cyanobacteria bacterium SW_9_44_58]|nr:MAG: cation transporter [Cyanobacteria bacterium SW_9_44_58]
MADNCCQGKTQAFKKLKGRQKRVLWIVLIINAVMFVIEFGGGLRAQALSLTGDSLDMLGDAFVYGSSLYVLNQGRKAQAKSALFKGGIMFLSAIAVFARGTYQLFIRDVPDASIISEIGLLALVANLICLFLLTRHRNDNINMSAVWLCSRNDIIANTSVLAAAGLVFLTHSPIPDLVVGGLLTVVFAKSAGKVLYQGWRELHTDF